MVRLLWKSLDYLRLLHLDRSTQFSLLEEPPHLAHIRIPPPRTRSFESTCSDLAEERYLILPQAPSAHPEVRPKDRHIGLKAVGSLVARKVNMISYDNLLGSRVAVNRHIGAFALHKGVRVRNVVCLCLLLSIGCGDDSADILATSDMGTVADSSVSDTSATDALADPSTADTFQAAADGGGDVSIIEDLDLWAETETDSRPPVAEPSNLRLNHLQALGTHNSYHKKPFLAEFIYQWNYEHLPLDEQMGLQGIRQFELDVYYDSDAGIFDVYHVAGIDDETTCATIIECIQTIKGWSDTHLGHHPFAVLVELKTDYNQAEALDLLNTLDAAILSVWPKDRLVTPDLVQGEHNNVRDAIADGGWPRIDDVRGRGLFVLHAGGQYASTYTENGATTAGRPMFPDAYGNLDLPYAAVHSMNNPKSGFDAIQQVVSAGHMVRTRSDSNSDEPNAGDYSRYEAALDSGAHFISTDYPGEPYGDAWAVNIPGGTPSRCNPISAPDGCTPEAIESGQLDM